MKCPIVIIHTGNPSYLNIALKQAKKSNPEHPLILLGDETNQKNKYATHYHIHDFMNSAHEFSKIYQHFSPNTPKFELFCLQRWFILSEFMQAHHLDKVFHLDSDVLCYTDVDSIIKSFSNKQMGFTWCSPHTLFTDKKSLDSFCAYVTDFYQHHQSEILKIYETLKPLGHGISDMTFFSLYKEKYPEAVGELGQEFSAGVCDVNLVENHLKPYATLQDDKTRFSMKGKFKAIIRKKKQLFFLMENPTRLVPALTLHFQGSSKKYMSYFASHKKFKKTFIFRSGFMRSLLYFIANLCNYQNERFLYKFKNKCLRLTGMQVGKRTCISHGLSVLVPQNIHLFNNVSIGHDNSFQGFSKITIHPFVQTAKDVSFVAGSHETDSFMSKANQEITVGPGCWIGTRVTILGGVHIGKGCVIGAGAVVVSDIPDFSIAVGVPAKVIKKRHPADYIIHPSRTYSLDELKKL